MLDRELQRKLLTAFSGIYPKQGRPNRDFEGYPDDDVTRNVFYLWEHGLIEAKWQFDTNGKPHSGAIRISAKGMDFLADDGGLSAILGTITVKLHDDTIRALLISKVDASDADPGTKAQLIAAVKSLPAEALKSLAQKAMDAGLSHLPAAIQPLQEWLGL